jgi:hypothetical protein
MLTIEDATLMGINAPRAHQRLIALLTTELTILYKKQRVIHLEPLPETMLDEDATSPAPDIILCDNEAHTVPVIIEITRSGAVHKDLKKVQQLIQSDDYGIVEGFVYDYNLHKWHKYHRDKGVVTDNPSFCEALNLDLATLL